MRKMDKMEKTFVETIGNVTKDVFRAKIIHRPMFYARNKKFRFQMTDSMFDWQANKTSK